MCAHSEVPKSRLPQPDSHHHAVIRGFPGRRGGGEGRREVGTPPPDFARPPCISRRLREVLGTQEEPNKYQLLLATGVSKISSETRLLLLKKF